MKKRHVYFLFLAFSIMLGACKTDFSVNGDFKEVPIVHFLLDPGQEYHFMKLNKTFLGDGNANVFAGIADSSYFDIVEARVEQYNKQTEQVVNTWLLKDTIIDNKNSGVFYYPEQKLYYFREPNLDNDEKFIYRLYCEIDNGAHILTGETELVREVNITSPNQNTAMRFANPPESNELYLNQSVRYERGTGFVFNTTMNFLYRDIIASGNIVNTVRYNAGDVRRSDFLGTAISSTLRGQRFYELVRDQVPVDDNVIRREVVGVELVVTAGSEDLLTYMLVNQPTTSIAQNKPEFTNVGGGLGIFSSRLTVRQYKPAFQAPQVRAMNSFTTRELSLGTITGHLGFCSHLAMDQGTVFSCN
jgi:hypothetical protein